MQASLERAERVAADWAKAALAGIPGGAAGRIALIDTQSPPALTEDTLLPLVTYSYAPDRPVTATRDYKRMWIGNVILPQLLSAAVQAGAAGAVMILDGSASDVAGQYLPYGNAVAGVPALLVDGDTGAALRRQARMTPKTRLTLTASEDKVVSAAADAVAYVDGMVVPHTVVGGLVEFTMHTAAGTPTDWAVAG
jgi:hypothetical protein